MSGVATRVPLTLHQHNAETLHLTIARVDPADDLTTITALELLIKPQACTPDDDAEVVRLSTGDPAQITITDQTAAQVTATAHIPASVLAQGWERWWRLDALVGAERRTALYGPVTVINL